MNAEQLLKQVKKIDIIIGRQEEKKTELMAAATSVSAPLTADKVQSSPNPHRMADAILKHLGVEEYILTLETAKQEIERLIESLSIDEYNVLYLTYFKYMTPVEITETVDRSIQWVYDTKRGALSDLQRKLDSGDFVSSIPWEF